MYAWVRHPINVRPPQIVVVIRNTLVLVFVYLQRRYSTRWSQGTPEISLDVVRKHPGYSIEANNDTRPDRRVRRHDLTMGKC